MGRFVMHGHKMHNSLNLVYCIALYTRHCHVSGAGCGTRGENLYSAISTFSCPYKVTLMREEFCFRARPSAVVVYFYSAQKR
eukprot:10331534-Ditylum_brightwellii.AAC.1